MILVFPCQYPYTNDTSVSPVSIPTPIIHQFSPVSIPIPMKPLFPCQYPYTNDTLVFPCQ